MIWCPVPPRRTAGWHREAAWLPRQKGLFFLCCIHSFLRLRRLVPEGPGPLPQGPAAVPKGRLPGGGEASVGQEAQLQRGGGGGGAGSGRRGRRLATPGGAQRRGAKGKFCRGHTYTPPGNSFGGTCLVVLQSGCHLRHCAPQLFPPSQGWGKIRGGGVLAAGQICAMVRGGRLWVREVPSSQAYISQTVSEVTGGTQTLSSPSPFAACPHARLQAALGSPHTSHMLRGARYLASTRTLPCGVLQAPPPTEKPTTTTRMDEEEREEGCNPTLTSAGSKKRRSIQRRCAARPAHPALGVSPSHGTR